MYMRMWMINPKMMCTKHLLGEHVELHMFVGTLKIGKNVNGYLENNLLEPFSIPTRHFLLVQEIENRGFKHNSPLEWKDEYLNHLTLKQKLHKVNVEQSLGDLVSRCPQCCSLFVKEVGDYKSSQKEYDKRKVVVSSSG